MSPKERSLGPSFSERLVQGSQAREAMIKRNLAALFAQGTEPQNSNQISRQESAHVIQLWRRLPRPVKVAAFGVTLLAAAACGGKGETEGVKIEPITPTQPPVIREVPTPTARPEPTPTPITYEMGKEALTKVDQFYTTRSAEIKSKALNGFKDKSGNTTSAEAWYVLPKIEFLLNYYEDQSARLNAGATVIEIFIGGYRTTQMPEFAEFARFFLAFMRTSKAMKIGIPENFEARFLTPLEKELNELETQFKSK